MTSTPSNDYNYDTFRPGPYVEGGCDGPKRGAQMGDVTLWRADSTSTSLGDIIEGVTVLEAGSTTCPLYRGNVQRMRSVARKHPDVTFVVLYTREAHPGGRRGPHRDLEDKLVTAAQLREDAGEWRQVVVDGVDGPLHRRLAGAPNSVLILNGQAEVIRWMHDADPAALDAILDGVGNGRPVDHVSTSFRPPPPHVALRALLRGGPKAVWDFALGMPKLLRYRLAGGASC